QADAGVAAGRLDDHRVLLDLAGLLASRDHRLADAVLDRPERVEVFELADDRRLAALRHPPQFHERRGANALGDVVIDATAKVLLSHEFLLCRLSPGRFTFRAQERET